MAARDANKRSSSRNRSSSSPGLGSTRKKKPREILNTIAFDSKGPRKYAVQLQKAGNGNPCLKIIEGIPNDDGSFRKIYLTIYSEDFEAFFRALGDTYRVITDQQISTPKNHKTPKTMFKATKKKESAGAEDSKRGAAA